MSVRDLRNPGWCWQEKAALRALRAFYSDDRLKQRSTALAVYLALTEAASNQHQQGHVEVVHAAVADATGTSRSTVKRYLADFAAIGLIMVEERKMETGTNLPNLYYLLTPRSTDEPQRATVPEGVGSTDGHQGCADGPLLKERSLKNGSQEEDDQTFIRLEGGGLTAARRAALARDHTRGGALDREAYRRAADRARRG